MQEVDDTSIKTWGTQLQKNQSSHCSKFCRSRWSILLSLDERHSCGKRKVILIEKEPTEENFSLGLTKVGFLAVLRALIDQ
jgi:hypothetical protein